MPERLVDHPTLHLDDLSDIRLLDRFYDVRYLEDRARLRADDGDVVASCSVRDEAFEAYCRQRLGLGEVTRLYPVSRRGPLRVASACWTDRAVRRALIGTLRADGLAYVHPHAGNGSVWAIASLLSQASRRPLKVIAPPPALTRRVNHKLWFAETVTRLFGPALIPRTASAWNFAALARVVRDMAGAARSIVVKLPDSAGGAGNVVVPAIRFRDRPLGSIRGDLKGLVRSFGWRGEARLLVGSWETDVLAAPSVQVWIPPEPQAPPVVEGLYAQHLKDIGGYFTYFTGSRPARLTAGLEAEVTDRCWLLARLFQRLGYVGRCSFDMILVGTDSDSARVEFIECNGRWGGTSLPMTLMNRLFGDWADRPYAAAECEVGGLERCGFDDLLNHFGDDLYDVGTGVGRFIFYNPGGLRSHGSIDALALDTTWDGAADALRSEVPARLAELASTRTP